MSKFVYVILSLMLCLSTSNHVFAAETVEHDHHVIKNDQQLQTFENEYQSLSIEELQQVIDSSKKVSGVNAIKAAWFAAAQIARLRGFNLSATLVEYSLRNKNYYESNGQFASAIKKTSVYPSMRKKRNGSVVFTKAMNADLYYSLHKCSYSSKGNSRVMRMTVYDTYDFKLEKNVYADLFTKLVNNWAYLSQHMNVLNIINVSISIDV